MVLGRGYPTAIYRELEGLAGGPRRLCFPIGPKSDGERRRPLRSQVWDEGSQGRRWRAGCGSDLVLCEDRQGDARIDQEPEYGPVFHVPVTAARKADSSIAARRASGESETAPVHVPEHSAALPRTVALH